MPALTIEALEQLASVSDGDAWREIDSRLDNNPEVTDELDVNTLRHWLSDRNMGLVAFGATVAPILKLDPSSLDCVIPLLIAGSEIDPDIRDGEEATRAQIAVARCAKALVELAARAEAA